VNNPRKLLKQSQVGLIAGLAGGCGSPRPMESAFHNNAICKVLIVSWLGRRDFSLRTSAAPDFSAGRNLFGIFSTFQPLRS
jgi:hypothetical protein